jgi:hypothetical protein
MLSSPAREILKRERKAVVELKESEKWKVER